MKVLIACGAGTDLEALVDDLRNAGFPVPVEVEVLSIADLLPIPADIPDPANIPAAVWRAREVSARARAEAQRIAEHAAAALKQAFPAWRITAAFQADAPAWAILKRADAYAPDLIVLSSNDRSMLRRVLLGSVSQTVLTHAHGSVRIVRPRRAGSTAAPRLLVGLDCSAHADAAAAAVAARTWKPGTEVRLVTALDATLATMLGFTDSSDDEREAAALSMQRADAMLRNAGLSVSSAVIDGDPKQVLLEEAERWKADCLFVGARGMGAVERILLGSVSAAVAARADCTVEVVRR